MANAASAPPIVTPLPPINNQLTSCALPSPSTPSLSLPLLIIPAATNALTAHNVLSEASIRATSYVTVTHPILGKSAQQELLQQALSRCETVTSKSDDDKADAGVKELFCKPDRFRYGHLRVQRGFGTKSAYFHPPHHHHSEVKSPYSCGGGTIIHISMLARHGTRNPTKGHLSRLRSLEGFLHDQMGIPNEKGVSKPSWLNELSARLGEWEKGPGALTEEGFAELRHIGRRFRQRYEPYLTSQAVKVRSSYKGRAISSAEAFLDGFGSKTEIDILEGGKRDSPLRFYDSEWNQHYADFVSVHKREMKKLPYGDDQGARDIAEKIARKLGCKETLKDDHLRRLVEYCAIERAQNRVPLSQLSTMFTADDLLYLEGFERRYTPFFNGHKLFDTLAAPLVRDLHESIERSVRRSTASSRSSSMSSTDSSDCSSFEKELPGLAYDEGQVEVADLRFAHAETLIPLLLLLGIPGIDGSNDLIFLSPFAGNLIIELWAPPESGPNIDADYRVRFRLHERYVERIEAVKGGHRGWLDLETLSEFFTTVMTKAL